MRRTIAGLLLLAACRGSLSPLSNKIDVGREPYVIFTADGEDGLGDLFASSTQGGTPFQITFTRVDERLPALSPDGSMLAFVRSRLPDDTSAVSLVVMNLLSGAERLIALPVELHPDMTAWSPDGRRLYVRAGARVLSAPAPPAEAAATPVPAAERAAADSALAVLLGHPPLAEAVPCAGGSGVCARLADGTVATVAAGGSAPARWPGDSIVYLEQGEWIVRPMAGGRLRVLEWTPARQRVRDLTTFPGAAKPE
jgi:WD40-like Beta Propeller Repeat